MIQQRLESIQPCIGEDTQTERGNLFEILADLTDEEGALAEMEDLGALKGWITDEPKIPRPGVKKRSIENHGRGCPLIPARRIWVLTL